MSHFSYEAVEIATHDAILGYSPAGHQATEDALLGKTHRTLGDLGMDSLDLVEILMQVEDETAVMFDDYDAEAKFTFEILAEEAAKVIYDIKRC